MLYTVTATNGQGIDGLVQLSNGKTVATNHPLNDQPGFNPEELIALAWSTCLNATLQAILKSQYLEKIASKVQVTVNLMKETETVGYYFEVFGQASIQNLDLATAEQLVKMAHARCPISKLIHQATTVHLKTVTWSDVPTS